MKPRRGQPFRIKVNLSKLNHYAGGEIMLPDGRYLITVIDAIKYAQNADVEIVGRCERIPNRRERREAMAKSNA